MWICHCRKNNKRVSKFHERCNRTSKDKSSSYDELLESNDSVSTYHRYLQVFASRMFKMRKGMPTLIMNDTFKTKEDPSYNLRNNDNLMRVFRLTENLESFSN